MESGWSQAPQGPAKKLVQVHDRSFPLGKQASVQPHQLQTCSIQDVASDVLRFILRLAIAFAKDMVTPKSLALICKTWYNALNDIRLWSPLFEQKKRERYALIGPKYRMHVQCFSKFTLLQRWACVSEVVLSQDLPMDFSGYAMVMKVQGENTTVREGRFIQGELRKGVELLASLSIFDSFYQTTEEITENRS